MKKETQLNRIKAHLLKGNTISSMQCFRDFNCTRLSGRIADIRAMGYNVLSYWRGEGQEKYKVYYIDRRQL